MFSQFRNVVLICALSFVTGWASNSLAIETSSLSLSDGTKTYNAPFVFESARQISTYGTANYAFAYEQVEKYGFKPISVGEGKAVLILSTLTYGQSSFGPYDEFLMMLPVQSKDSEIEFTSVLEFIKGMGNLNTDPDHPVSGNFMLKLILGGENKRAAELGVILGKALYGYPKFLGNFQIDFDHELEKNYTVSDNFNQLKIDLIHKTINSTEPIYYPFQKPTFAITTGNGVVQWQKTVLTGKGTAPIAFTNSQFKLTTTGEDRKFMSALSFVPEYWNSVKELHIVLTPLK